MNRNFQDVSLNSFPGATVAHAVLVAWRNYVGGGVALECNCRFRRGNERAAG